MLSSVSSSKARIVIGASVDGGKGPRSLNRTSYVRCSTEVPSDEPYMSIATMTLVAMVTTYVRCQTTRFAFFIRALCNPWQLVPEQA